MSAVRDMYEGLDFGNMTESEQRRHRNIQLNQHPDVLFRVYRRGHLHVLLFRPTDGLQWMRLFRDRHEHLFAQWTIRHRQIRDVISVSGQMEELEGFCDRFIQHLQGFQDNDDEIEELRARIRELELENRRLREQ
ncbi:hypothetical protein DPX16_1303 [Anabarilius grahami]|uniref:Uncharacterized protein n=1 Tax=Anabarilius grahami TaxID=495550 RepID=A0A3N0Y8P7_ANAGA|nr:hypothetical protein DPX16_1303 [Anabarilius grahami]